MNKEKIIIKFNMPKLTGKKTILIVIIGVVILGGTYYGLSKASASKNSDTINTALVTKGDLLYVIDTKDIDNDINKAEVSLEKQQLSHNQTLESYAGLSVEAPISGDTLDSDTKSTTMAVVADMSQLTFDIDVDIGKIEVGQEVQVTADSLEGQTFTGKIDNISKGPKAPVGDVPGGKW